MSSQTRCVPALLLQEQCKLLLMDSQESGLMSFGLRRTKLVLENGDKDETRS